MRTTVNIDDDMLKLARLRATEEGTTLGALVTDALRERLIRRPRAEQEPFEVVTWGEGGTHPGIDLNNNAAVRDVLDGFDPI